MKSSARIRIFSSSDASVRWPRTDFSHMLFSLFSLGLGRARCYSTLTSSKAASARTLSSIHLGQMPHAPISQSAPN